MPRVETSSSVDGRAALYYNFFNWLIGCLQKKYYKTSVVMNSISQPSSNHKKNNSTIVQPVILNKQIPQLYKKK